MQGVTSNFNANVKVAPGPKSGKGAKPGKVQAPKPAKVTKPGKGPKVSAPKVNTNPLYNPNAILSGNDLKNAAGSIADAQTTGPISELAKQIAQNNATTSATQQQDFGYYMQLAKDAQAAVANEGQVSQGLNSTLAGIGANTQSQLAGIGQQAQGGAVGRMAALGLDGGASAAVGAETARQQGIGALNSQTFQQQGATQGASNEGQAIADQGAQGLAGTAQIGNVGRAGALANAPLNSKIAALQASKGALTATALGQLRTQERNYQVAQAGLGIKSATVANTAQNNAANQTIKIRGQNLTAQNNATKNSIASAYNAARLALAANGQNITKQNNLANQAYHQAVVTGKYGAGAGAGAAGTKPLSSAQNEKALGQLQRAVGVIHQAQAFRDATHPNGYTEQQIRAGLGQKYQIPDYLIQAAYELVGYGSIDQSTAAYLHGVGIRGGTYNGAPIKVTKNYKAPNPYTKLQVGNGSVNVNLPGF